MAAWYEVQANPERATAVGNAAIVAPGAVEVEGGGELALFPSSGEIALLTPLRIKFGVHPRLQVHLSTEGFLIRPDRQRPAGVGGGLKIPLLADPESSWPDVSARLDAWSPAPTPAGGTARLQAELVGARTWGGLGVAASAGGDFAADGTSSPAAGLAAGWPALGDFGVMAEARYRAGLPYAGLAGWWRSGRESVLDLGAGFRLDGAVLVRLGFTRAFALDP